MILRVKVKAKTELVDWLATSTLDPLLNQFRFYPRLTDLYFVFACASLLIGNDFSSAHPGYSGDNPDQAKDESKRSHGGLRPGRPQYVRQEPRQRRCRCAHRRAQLGGEDIFKAFIKSQFCVWQYELKENQGGSLDEGGSLCLHGGVNGAWGD